jgi:23S rRNA pseudouridine2605 synthase
MALPRPKLVHYVIHKPVGVVSTNYDQSGRPRVVDLVPKRDNERLFAVGRLDLSSEGLMLLTNDGELANRITHPRYGVEKTYHAEVAGAVDRDALARLRKGTHLAEGFARVASARVRSQWKKSTLLEIVLAEGRNREIRRLLAREGHKVLRLTRVAMGPLRLGELPPGAWRPIDPAELRALRQAAFASRGAPRRKRPGASAPKPAVRLAPPSTPTVIGGDASPAPARPAPARERSIPGAGAQAPRKPRSGDRRPRAAGGKRPGQEGRKLIGPAAGKKTAREGGKKSRGHGGDRQRRSGAKGSRP